MPVFVGAGTSSFMKGSDGVGVSTATTSQRNALSGVKAGQLIYNDTTNLMEYYNGSSWVPIDTAPTVSSVNNSNITQAQIDAGFDLVITGSFFKSGATVQFIGNDATSYNSPSVAVNSTTQITARVHTSVSNANEPYDVKVTNPSGLSGLLSDAFNVNARPVWSTSSGTVATISDNATGTHATLAASDPEGDTVTYSGTVGGGMSLNSSSGAITGDPTNVNSSTTVSFTANATSSGVNTTSRSFNIVVNPVLDGTTAGRANTSASAIKTAAPSSSNGWYYIKPTGYSGSAFQVYCDFNVASGGWMHVATIHDDTNDLNNTSNNKWSYGLHRTGIDGGSITHDNNATGYWGSTTHLNSGQTGSGTGAFTMDYKHTAYNEVPFTQILMRDAGSTLRNLWYTTNSVPNAGTYATSAQNWFATGGRSGNVWQTSGSNRSNPSNALDLGVTSFGAADDVFGSGISSVIFFFGEPSGTDSGNQDRSMITAGAGGNNTGSSVSTTQGLGVSRATNFSSQVWRDVDPTFVDEPSANSVNYSYSLWVR